jgi:hypothetical protein
VTNHRKQKFSLHSCVLDSGCRGDIGWCWRLDVNTPWWHLGIALRPKDRYVRMTRREPFTYALSWVYFQRW